MRYVELELESAAAPDLDPPLRDVQALSMPGERLAIVCDRPDGRTPRLTRLAEGVPAEIDLGAGFRPRLLADADDGRVLAIAGGGAGALFEPEGRVIRRYDLGEGIVDAACDPDGNIVVLRSGRPLLDRFDPDGTREEGDSQLQRIDEQTKQEEGILLLIQRDGTIWLNLAEKYDGDGELIETIDPAEVFGAGRVAADLFGWHGLLVVNEEGKLFALEKDRIRTVRLPAREIEKHLGRGLSAARNLIATRDERLLLLDVEARKFLGFRILSE